MKYQEPTADDYLHIAEKVRSGEYFREARSMYDLSVNDPMSERYFYVFVTLVSLFTFFCALLAVQSLYPLNRSVPFIYALNDVVDDLPSITPLRKSPEESVDDAVLLFMAKTYVTQYESYNIMQIERNYNGVESMSSPEVMAAYQALLQTSNPDSPVAKYERHSARNIEILALQKLSSPPNTVEVWFDATVVNAERSERTRHRATLAYQFSGVEFDEKADKVKPVTFTVMHYTSRNIQGM